MDMIEFLGTTFFILKMVLLFVCVFYPLYILSGLAWFLSFLFAPIRMKLKGA